jgi:hypothetical protein
MAMNVSVTSADSIKHCDEWKSLLTL